MRVRAGLLAAVAVCGLAAAPPTTARSAIIGGGPASGIGYGAQVYVDGGFTCTGSVVAPQWVLTAGHCDGDRLTVRVGSLDLGAGEQATVTAATSAPDADLLLLHLDHPVSAAAVHLGDANPPAGATNRVYGWGRTSGDDPNSAVLKVATVRVTGTDLDAVGGPAIASTGIDGSSWHGDSGGPELDATGALVGVCSTGENSGHDPHGTQSYTSVPANRRWITDTAGI